MALVVNNPPTNAGDRCGFNPWVWKIPLEEEMEPTPVFLPEKSRGQRSVEASVYGVIKSDMTETT